MGPSESQTRRELIDRQLLAAGWDASSYAVLAEHAVQLGRALDGEVAYQVGFADYVLLDPDGRPLAVVEAKRSSRDPVAGQRQAAEYADALAASGPAPFVYLANGRAVVLGPARLPTPPGPRVPLASGPRSATVSARPSEVPRRVPDQRSHRWRAKPAVPARGGAPRDGATEREPAQAAVRDGNGDGQDPDGHRAGGPAAPGGVGHLDEYLRRKLATVNVGRDSLGLLTQAYLRRAVSHLPDVYDELRELL